jgi:hypothetical protein
MKHSILVSVVVCMLGLLITPLSATADQVLEEQFQGKWFDGDRKIMVEFQGNGIMRAGKLGDMVDVAYEFKDGGKLTATYYLVGFIPIWKTCFYSFEGSGMLVVDAEGLGKYRFNRVIDEVAVAH